MRHIKVPAQEKTLFDLQDVGWWATQLSSNGLRYLEESWQGVFRRSVLKELEKPVEAIGTHFDESQGRPSKELYAVCGLLLIAEFKDYTVDETAEAWSFDAGVQYALDLPRDRQYLSARSVDNYRKLLRENGNMQEVFTTVTSTLVRELEVSIERQRLDSTHVLSHMAKLSRLQLLSVSVRRFLVQLKRYDLAGYQALDSALRERYELAETRLFGLGTRKPQPREEALQQAAEDLAFLVGRFAQEPKHHARKSYLALVRLLSEHCEIKEDKVVVRPRSVDEQGGSGQCLQNPSDPGAGYSGHKGAGYQVQIAQALPPRDADGEKEGPGLITACLSQSAAVHDSEALGPVLDQQKAAGLLPGELTADTHYGSDANVQFASSQSVELISPVGGVAPKAGKVPVHHCTKKESESKKRLNDRREQQGTEKWKKDYASRSGIEGVNRALDVVTGLKELRVRGTRAVQIAVTLKITGWNILAAAKIRAFRARKARRQQQNTGKSAGSGGKPAQTRLRPSATRALRRRLPLPSPQIRLNWE